MRMGALIAVKYHLLPEGGIIAFIEPIEIGDFTVLLLVSYPAIKDKTSVGMCSDPVAQVGSDQGTVDDLAKAIRDIDVADLQFIDGPAVVSADPPLCLTLCKDCLLHIRPEGHVLSRQRAAGKGLFYMQRLPVTFELIVVALLTQIVPHIFDRYVQGTLEQIIRHLGAPVRKAVSLPVRGVEHHLFLGHLYLGKGNRDSQHGPDKHQSYNGFFHKRTRYHFCFVSRPDFTGCGKMLRESEGRLSLPRTSVLGDRMNARTVPRGTAERPVIFSRPFGTNHVLDSTQDSVSWAKFSRSHP